MQPSISVVPHTIPLCLLTVFFALNLPGQSSEPARFAKPIQMPASRAQDSDEIYALLLKSGPIEWRDSDRKQWLVENTTIAIPFDAACNPAAGSADSLSSSTGPHSAVQPPADRRAEWDEVLTDYDQHCHDVVLLNAQRFNTALPVRFLTAQETKQFTKDPGTPPPELAGSAGLHSFSQVFFNPSHTLALVEQGMWCGLLCGNYTWVALEKQNRVWRVLPWVHTFTVS